MALLVAQILTHDRYHRVVTYIGWLVPTKTSDSAIWSINVAVQKSIGKSNVHWTSVVQCRKWTHSALLQRPHPQSMASHSLVGFSEKRYWSWLQRTFILSSSCSNFVLLRDRAILGYTSVHSSRCRISFIFHSNTMQMFIDSCCFNIFIRFIAVDRQSMFTHQWVNIDCRLTAMNRIKIDYVQIIADGHRSMLTLAGTGAQICVCELRTARWIRNALRSPLYLLLFIIWFIIRNALRSIAFDVLVLAIHASCGSTES